MLPGGNWAAIPRPPVPADGVRLAIVAALGAWAGAALTDGAKWGAVGGAGAAVLLVTTDTGARLLAQASALVRPRVPDAVPLKPKPVAASSEPGRWDGFIFDANDPRFGSIIDTAKG